MGKARTFLRQADFQGRVSVIPEKNRIPQHVTRVQGEGFGDELGNFAKHDRLVLLGNQTVVQDPQGLVSPQPHELRARVVVVLPGTQQPLVYPAQVTQVEDVVKPGSRNITEPV